jgi:hypothetical protein
MLCFEYRVVYKMEYITCFTFLLKIRTNLIKNEQYFKTLQLFFDFILFFLIFMTPKSSFFNGEKNQRLCKPQNVIHLGVPDHRLYLSYSKTHVPKFLVHFNDNIPTHDIAMMQ